MPLRPEFLEALELVAAASEDVVAAGLPRPVLVGGSAVEFFTGGTFTTGDLDFVAEAQREFEAALLKRGFERASGPGALLRGYLHRKLGIGVEVVGSRLMDGAADERRVAVVRFGTGELAVTPIEDIIADRVAQYESGSGGHQEMLTQAQALYRLASDLDLDYLKERLRHETGGRLGIDILKDRT